MKKSRFSEEQNTLALRQAEAGTPVGEICQKLGIARETTLCFLVNDVSSQRKDNVIEETTKSGYLPVEKPPFNFLLSLSKSF